MRKLLLFIWIVLSINLIGQVQTIGVQGGLNLTNISGEPDVEYRIGLLSGLNYEYLSSKGFSIGADLLYNQQGFKLKCAFTDELGNSIGNFELKFNYDYFSFPVKVGYTFGNKFKAFGKIGVVPSFLIKAEEVFPIPDMQGNVSRYETQNVTSDITKIDIGGLIEIGAEYGIIDNIDLFSSVIGRKSITKITDSEWHNYGFSILFGLKYKFDNNNN